MARVSEAQARAWVSQWAEAAVALERVRLEELAAIDLAVVADQLEEASLAAAASRVATTTSGLVEQQRLFHRQRR